MIVHKLEHRRYKNVLVKVENVKQLATILALKGFLFSSQFGNFDLENLSTIIQIRIFEMDSGRLFLVNFERTLYSISLLTLEDS